MKSSPYRKRYIVVRIEDLPSRLRQVESALYRVFRARRKYVEREFAVFRTNQLYKEKFIDFVRAEMDGVETVITSGSMKKCKRVISRISEEAVLKART